MAKKTDDAIRISFVVPVLDEEESLRQLDDEITTVCEANAYTYEVIYVDDGSRDGSVEVMRTLAAERPGRRVVRLRRNRGKAEALQCGFNRTRGDYVVTMDADLQDDASELPKLLAACEAGADLVSGWKRDRHDPLVKRIASKIFNGATCWLFKIQLHDINCGFKCYKREVLEHVRIYGELHRFIPALASALGFSVEEVAVNHRARKFGHSKYRFGRFLKGILDAMTVTFLTGYARRPMHIFGLAGLVMGAVGFCILTYMTILRCLGETVGTRPLLLIGVLFAIFGAQLVVTGLLAEQAHWNLGRATEEHFVSEVIDPEED
jgi:glycosyltransferase involved in cell wall biosynthesis